MPNMSLVKHPMPEQDPQVRAGNFQEVALGYTREIALEEAQRCLQCKNAPCVTGCPVNVPIRDFIGKIRDGEIDEAYRIIRSQNALPAICGRVCPQESQCESKCVRGIKGEPVAIGRLERFAADTAMANGIAGTEKKATLKKHIRSSVSQVRFRLFADVSARRKASVKENVSAVSKVIRSPSANWNALLQIMHRNTALNRFPLRRRTVIKLP